MLTLIDLLTFVFFVMAAVVTAAIGKNTFGSVGAIGGLVFGAAVGYFVAGKLNFLLWRYTLRPTIRKLRALSLDELKDRVRKPMFELNLHLLELQYRGEDMRQYLPIVVAYLTSAERFRRGFGLAALRSAYPELESKIRGYSLRDSVDECKRKASGLLTAETENRPADR